MKKFQHLRQALKFIVAFSLAGVLSGCDQPIPGMYYKSTVSAPPTASITQAYQDIADEMWADTKEIVAMDRYRHGIRPALDKTPVQYAQADTLGNVTFDRYQSLYFKVYSVEVIDQYKAPISMDYREHLPVDTSDAVHSWANRLRPTGGLNKLQVVIKDAPIQNASLNGNKHYDARLAIEMRICSRDGTVLASVSSISAQQAMDVNGAAGADMHKAALNSMLSRLIDTINGDLESKMAHNFSPYIDHAKAG